MREPVLDGVGTAVSTQVGVRIAGRGGQGVMLAGLLVAQSAIDDGLEVVQTQSYGPEARLGAAKSDVILSPEAIAYPEISSPDVFMCLSHDAFTAYSRDVTAATLLIVDSRAAAGLGVGEALLVPMIDTARDCGSPIAANIVGLGFLLAVTRVVSERSLRRALSARARPESLDTNMRALDAGLALAAEMGVQPGQLSPAGR